MMAGKKRWRAEMLAVNDMSFASKGLFDLQNHLFKLVF
jgi:hypothetical protein